MNRTLPTPWKPTKAQLLAARNKHVPDLAAMGADQLGRDGKAEAGAARAGCRNERLEQFPPHALGNAGSAVGDVDGDDLVALAQLHADHAARRAA